MSDTVSRVAPELKPVADATKVTASGPVWILSRIPVTVKSTLAWPFERRTVAGRETIPGGDALRLTVTAFVVVVFRVTVTNVLLPFEMLDVAAVSDRVGPFVSRICSVAVA